jgi:class 3 adenylate cyclase
LALALLAAYTCSVNCPTCGQPNRDRANYCRFCGAHFARHCPRCRAVLPDDSRFCDQCGLALGPAPATAVPAAQLTAAPVPAVPTPLAGPRAAAAPQLQQFIPDELMRKLESARARGEMVGERRIVTMLFCDVQGSTAAAERLDPEDYSEVMNGAFEHMIKPVYKYEGTLARLMGDALLAFFGAPIAHEDDPQRAVLAGLDIVAAIQPYAEQVRQQWGLNFNVRVGINTGLVVVGAVGSDLRVEYSALGDAINLAARMEQTADPGTVRVAHETYRAVRGQFEFEALGGIEVKGKSEPVLAYRVLSRKTVPVRQRGIEGLFAEMVGREAELAALRGVLADLRQGVGRIVCVLGEAGLGKSRLVAEARRLFQAQTEGQGYWLETSSLSYESHQAYGLFQRLIAPSLGLEPGDPPTVRRDKLAALAQGLPPERWPRAAQALEALFGLGSHNGDLPLEGEAFRNELCELMEAWWRQRFGVQPTVLVFDDMHWADAASVKLLLQLLPLAGEMPLVLLFALRAERHAPAWQLKLAADERYAHRYTEIALRPLSDADSNELVSRLLAIAELPGRLRASILEKSSGNPFFIEEVVRTLIDSGVVVCEEREAEGGPRRYWRAASEEADFAIPSNLQTLLAARMDRLEEATRGTLQLASVIGRSFHRRVLQAVDEEGPELDKHLGTLLRLEMIREAARIPEVEYAFRNPLTQEAVYQTILLKRRRAFHRRVGEVIEALYADRLEGMLGLLAHHFTLAGERGKAIAFSRQAAQQAVAVFAYDDAARSLRSALALLEGGDQAAAAPERLALLEELGDVYRLLRNSEAAIGHYHRALEAWQALPQPDERTALRLHRKRVQMVTELKWSVSLEAFERAGAQRLESVAQLRAALPGLLAGPPQLETVRVLAALSTDYWRVEDPADWEAAQRMAEEAVRLARALDSPRDLSQALGALATVLDGRSLLREHRQVAEQRLALVTQPGFEDVRETLDATRGLGAALMYVGEYQPALAHLRAAEALAVAAQAVDQQANSIGLQAQCLFRLDRWDEVLAIEAKWRDLEQRFKRERIGETCFFVALSASVHALRGDLARANAYGQESLDYMISMSGQADHWQRNQFY